MPELVNSGAVAAASNAHFGTTPDHPDVLATRDSIVAWTGEHGDGGGVLQLLQELLPNPVRVLGPDQPNVLTTCSNIAFWKARPVTNAGHEPEVDPEDPEPGTKSSGS